MTDTQTNRPRLTLFDLDHTLLPIDSDYEWGEFTIRIGWNDPVEFARRNDEFYAHYQAGTLDLPAYIAFTTAAWRDRPLAESAAAHQRFMAEVLHPHIQPQALELVRKQADFILGKLVGKNGLVHDGLTLGGKLDAGQSIDAQFAAIRGLTAAFLATSDAKYRTAARELFIATDKAYFNTKAGTWLASKQGEYTPWTQAAISGALRSAMLNLRNEGAEKAPELELAKLTGQYVSWFRGTVNGGMQMAEWVGDSGENVIDGAGGDTDEDGVPQVTAAGGKHGTAMVMAAKALITET